MTWETPCSSAAPASEQMGSGWAGPGLLAALLAGGLRRLLWDQPREVGNVGPYLGHKPILRAEAAVFKAEGSCSEFAPSVNPTGLVLLSWELHQD